MSGQKHKTDFSAYEQEKTDAFDKLAKSAAWQEELAYFIEIAKKHFSMLQQHNALAIVVLGPNIPEELVYAGGQAPYWVLGGSRASSIWADGYVPRDTDPVSRSAMGYFKSGFGKGSLILAPLVNDSARKLAYLLQSDGFKVHSFHFPPVKNETSFVEWERQYDACRIAIARHLKRPVTRGMLRKSAGSVRQAKECLREFLNLSAGILPGSIRHFVSTSYYFADDLPRWAAHLREWSAKLLHMAVSRPGERSKVLLLGSPIYFPNYKVPFLIEEAGLEISGQANYSTLQVQSRQSGFYLQDVSPAYVKNDALFQQVQEWAHGHEIDGVV